MLGVQSIDVSEEKTTVAKAVHRFGDASSFEDKHTMVGVDRSAFVG
jgi:hypothetical protein